MGRNNKSQINFKQPGEEELLVEWYRDQQLLYAISNSEYHNRPKKQRILSEKAAELGITCEYYYIRSGPIRFFLSNVFLRKK